MKIRLTAWFGLCLALGLGLGVSVPGAFAQSAPASGVQSGVQSGPPSGAVVLPIKGQVLALKGTTLKDAAFDISELRGKVVMVFYWSTRCSVCLSHMPELRANLAGWRGKPFALVTVNVDTQMAEWRSYEQIASQTQTERPVAIWTGKSPTQKLPLTLVLDTKGRMVARHDGRIATESWDEVAEILP